MSFDSVGVAVYAAVSSLQPVISTVGTQAPAFLWNPLLQSKAHAVAAVQPPAVVNVTVTSPGTFVAFATPGSAQGTCFVWMQDPSSPSAT